MHIYTHNLSLFISSERSICQEMAEDESKAAVSKDCLYDNFCVFVVLLFSLNLIQSQDSKEPEAKLHSFLCFRNSCIWMRCWYTATFGPGTNGWCCGNEGQPIQSGHCFNSWSIMMCMLIWRMNRDLLLRSLRPKVLGKRIVMAKLCVCLCWQASKHKGKRSSKAWHAVVTSFWAAMFISICHRQWSLLILPRVRHTTTAAWWEHWRWNCRTYIAHTRRIQQRPKQLKRTTGSACGVLLYVHVFFSW